MLGPTDLARVTYDVDDHLAGQAGERDVDLADVAQPAAAVRGLDFERTGAGDRDRMKVGIYVVRSGRVPNPDLICLREWQGA